MYGGPDGAMSEQTHGNMLDTMHQGGVAHTPAQGPFYPGVAGAGDPNASTPFRSGGGKMSPRSRLRLKKIRPHEVFEPPKVDPMKEVVFAKERGTEKMEEKFAEKFDSHLLADKLNLDYLNPAKEEPDNAKGEMHDSF